MSTVPKLSDALIEAYNAWLDSVELNAQARTLTAQILMTGDYSNKGRPKYLQVAVDHLLTTHRYGAGQTPRQEIAFFIGQPAEGEEAHAALRIYTLEAVRVSADPMSAVEQEPYRTVASLNGLIQKLTSRLASEQQTQALALAVYFTAAVRWCITEGYQMIDGQKDVDPQAPSLRFWFYNAKNTHSVIHLDYTPFKSNELNFTSISSLRTSKA